MVWTMFSKDVVNGGNQALSSIPNAIFRSRMVH